MALNIAKKIFRRSWGFIPMPDTVISQGNALGRNQPKQLTFIERLSRLIGYVEIPIVDAELEEEEVKLPEMDLKVNFKLPGVDEEWQEAPQVFGIDDTEISPYPHPI